MQLLQDLVAIDALEAPQGQQLHRAKRARRHDAMTRAPGSDESRDEERRGAGSAADLELKHG